MREVWAYVVQAGIRYPVHWWTPRPEHGDLSTDLAFVLAKVSAKEGEIGFELSR